MAALTIPQRNVLGAMLHRTVDRRFDASNLNKLQVAGLVSSEIIRVGARGRLSVNRRWSITEAGSAAYRNGWY